MFHSNIFSSIDDMIKNRENFGGRKYFQWKLPRAIGTTTYIFRKIEKILAENPDAFLLYMSNKVEIEYAHRFFMISNSVNTALDRRLLLKNINNFNLNSLRGIRPDAIFIDSILHQLDTAEFHGRIMFEILSMLNTSANNYCLHLESTNGE